ncbi:MAG: DUF58 domain-containing protein [Anaerolineae bacterium]|nr:DUF58 domain-containing protein [Anaerolineae bacterium]
MTSALRLLLGLIFAVILVGVATLHRSVLALAIPLLAYVFAALLRRPEALALDVRREVTPDYAPQGAPITIRLTITNQGAAIDELAVQDVLPEGVRQIDGQAAMVTFLDPHDQVELEYTIAAHRGAYDTYEVEVAARDFMSFFERPASYRTTPQLIVHPHYPKLERIKIRPPQTRGFAGPIGARQGGSGVDFWGVREYQSGDPQRQINWKLAARPDQKLYTNIFEQERVADVGIILDARQRVDVVTTSGSLFEHSVHAAAALAENFLEDGNRVSLVIYGSGMGRVFPGYGRHQRERILKALSRARPGINYALENLASLPTRFFPAKSQIVLVSPLSPDDIPVIIRMRALGYAVMVISPDPISYEAALYQDFSSPAYHLAFAERDFMLRQIRRSGAQVLNWRVDQPLQTAVREILTRQPPIIHVQGGAWA